MAELVFWVSLLALVWTYAGYPATMLVRGMLVRGRVRGSARQAADSRRVGVTAVVAVRNGAPYLGARVENLLTQAYPPELLEVQLALNGCTDGSARIAGDLAAASDRVRVLESPASEGKAGALNRGVAAARGEVIIFADVRQTFEPDAVQCLVDAVLEPGTGATSGRLLIPDGGPGAVRGMSRYWSFETKLRNAEALTGSVVGVTGAIYAVRRELFQPIPPGTILDDVYEPLRIAMRGHRIGFEPLAIAADEPSADTGSEYRRRVRTLLGNLQVVALIPHLLDPRRNPLFLRFVSHKLMRVLSPLFLLGLLAAGLIRGEGLYAAVAFTGLALLALGALGLVVRIRVLAIPAAFLMIQVAALEALIRRRRAAADVWTA